MILRIKKKAWPVVLLYRLGVTKLDGIRRTSVQVVVYGGPVVEQGPFKSVMRSRRLVCGEPHRLVDCAGRRNVADVSIEARAERHAAGTAHEFDYRPGVILPPKDGGDRRRVVVVDDVTKQRNVGSECGRVRLRNEFFLDLHDPVLIKECSHVAVRFHL